MQVPIRGKSGQYGLFLPEWRLWFILSIGIFSLFSGGCGQVSPGEGGTIGLLDHNVFKASIQPILDNKACSSSGCHFRDKSDPNSGGPGGSLRLFDCKGAACTAEQLQANHDSSAGMANLVNPGESKLLSKPLELSVGGLQHLGGTIFPDVTDADYLAIFAWIGSPL